MQRESWPASNRAAWLARRARDLTASRIAALFDAHPFLTRDALADQLRHGAPRIDNVYMRAGRILEPGIAVAISEERPAWRLTKAIEYWRLPDLRLGATPDYLLDDDGLIEAKTVSPDQWARWGARPPLAYFLQAAVQMIVIGRTRGVLAVMLRSLPDLPLHFFDVPRSAEAEEIILDAVHAWWAAFDRGELPPAAPVSYLTQIYGTAVPARSPAPAPAPAAGGMMQEAMMAARRSRLAK